MRILCTRPTPATGSRPRASSYHELLSESLLGNSNSFRVTITRLHPAKRLVVPRVLPEIGRRHQNLLLCSLRGGNPGQYCMRSRNGVLDGRRTVSGCPCLERPWNSMDQDALPSKGGRRSPRAP